MRRVFEQAKEVLGQCSAVPVRLSCQNQGQWPDPAGWSILKSFGVYADCDFAGNWVKEDAMNSPSTLSSPEQVTSLAMEAAQSCGHQSHKLQGAGIVRLSESPFTLQL